MRRTYPAALCPAWGGGAGGSAMKAVSEAPSRLARPMAVVTARCERSLSSIGTMRCWNIALSCGATARRQRQCTASGAGAA
jgi:hypothetical protein